VRRVPWFGALLLVCTGCKNEASRAAPVSSASASTTATASASATASATSPRAVEYVGTYDSKPNALYVPDGGEWKGFKFRGDVDAGALGEGTLSFTVDAKTGDLSGKLEGPLGPATLSGVAQSGVVSFHVAPESAGDMSFKGTGTGTLDGGVVSGRIEASSWHANVLREASFSAKAK